jgi:hypothetical protein
MTPVTAFRGRGKHFLFNDTQTHDYERLLQSALNKITDTNFSTISKKILGMYHHQKSVSDDDSRVTKLFISHILHKCYTQVALLNIYCKLISELRDFADNDSKTLIDDVVEGFVDDFLVNSLPLAALNHSRSPSSSSMDDTDDSTSSNGNSNSGTEYDDFCRSVVQRSHLIGKHMTILAMIQNFLYMSGARYLEDVLTIYREGSDANLQEILLDILHEFVKFDKTLASRIQHHVRHTTFVANNRARFKVQDIMDV